MENCTAARKDHSCRNPVADTHTYGAHRQLALQHGHTQDKAHDLCGPDRDEIAARMVFCLTGVQRFGKLKQTRYRKARHPAAQRTIEGRGESSPQPVVANHSCFLSFRSDQARSKRSRFMTLDHAAAKSFTNFSFASADP